MPYYAIVRDLDQMVVGTVGDTANEVVTALDGYTLKSITKIKHDQTASQGVTARDGRLRHKVVTDNIVEQKLEEDVYLIAYDTATGMVRKARTLSWAHADALGHVHDGGLGRSVYIATEQEYSDVANGGKHEGDNKPRWKVVGGVLSENPDTRDILRPTPSDVAVAQGAPAVSVTVEVVDENGDVRTGVNTTISLRARSGARIPVVLTSGVGSLSVSTDTVRTDWISSTPQHRFVARLRIEVYPEAV